MYNPQSDRQDMRRKISLLTTVLIFSALQAYAQLTPQYTFNALQLSSQYYDGTARSLAMGNAMTALGGDMGALSYNPAASGVYRYSEFTLTPSLYSGVTTTGFLNGSFKDSRTRFALSNVGWTGSFDTGRTRGLLNINLAVTANQTNNFAFRSSGSGLQSGSSYLGSLAASVPQGVLGYDLDMLSDYDEYPFYNSGASWTHVLAWNAGLLDTLAMAQTRQGHFEFTGSVEAPQVAYITSLTANDAGIPLVLENTDFTVDIVNVGGMNQGYTVQNLPSWLDVSEPSGTLAPASTHTLQFRVSEALNVGTYDQVLYLVNDNNVARPLNLTVKVNGDEADYIVRPQTYEDLLRNNEVPSWIK